MNKERFFSFLTGGLVLISLPFLVASLPQHSGIHKQHNIIDLNAENWAKQQLATLSLEEKIGQFFMVAAYPDKGDQHLSEVEGFVKTNKVGGVIFFQSDKATFLAARKRLQDKASIPLFIGMDAEFGTRMRLSDGERFPYAYTLGAAHDPALSERVAATMAQECQQLGIHINFAPVADVNSNPKNPVIGFRSFGENPTDVSQHVAAFVKGFEQNGILSCIKHFPGHGNTDTDSHLELPTVSLSRATLDAIDFVPFKAGIDAGASGAMIGHLNVPALDNSGKPSSLSQKIIQGVLKKDLGFNGLVFSDALNMKAVANRYGKTEAVVNAFEAGCDILLFPESVSEAINALKTKVEKGSISQEMIDQRCLSILKAKYRFVLHPTPAKKFTEGEVEWARTETIEKALTVIKNDNAILPLKDLNKKILRISVGSNSYFFREGIELFASVDHLYFDNYDSLLAHFPKNLDQYDVIITALHATSVRPKDHYGMGADFHELFAQLPTKKQNILAIFGNPLFVQELTNLSAFDAIVLGYENNKLAQKSVAQLIFGALPAVGKLPFTIDERFPLGTGIQVKWGGRLKFSQPEELGINSEKLNQIDAIAQNGIAKGAFPGCQIVVAIEGKIIYRKAFGTHEFGATDTVQLDDVYDIASISKIAGSTLGVMRLQTRNSFSLSKQLGDYLPEVTGKTPYSNILLRDMMAHQAGLTPWIPFFKRTLQQGQPNPRIYSSEKKEGYEVQVADKLWIKTSYVDSIYQQLMSTPLGAKKYEYSDLGYYFIKKIIEKQANSPFQSFLMNELYLPMGLRSMRYQPRNYFALKQIVPTENDQAFRKQLIHGYVHDPGAAMLGGIGGHAGLFSNATDLASLMQLFLNKGTYGTVSYLNPAVVEEYTKAQFSGNRRGAGFDRPNPSGGGTCCELASSASYGHSGFTGTLAWADPMRQINYVFLSNRVCPSQDNWKIREMNIRTEIQRVIYQALTN
jgi:beta-N-acetylhexosaminidase